MTTFQILQVILNVWIVGWILIQNKRNANQFRFNTAQAEINQVHMDSLKLLHGEALEQENTP